MNLGMESMGPGRYRATSIEDLTAIVALYRPGPMDSIPKFIANKQDVYKRKAVALWAQAASGVGFIRKAMSRKRLRCLGCPSR